VNNIRNEAQPPDQSLPKRMRLRAPQDFQRVYQHRRSVSDNRLLIYALPNELPYTRLGASVSRKVGGAVERNRWRRLLREAFRLSRHAMPTGLDLIAIPRVNAPPTLDELRASLTQLVRRVEKRARS
jgi:ribonuclease P protein component